MHLLSVIHSSLLLLFLCEVLYALRVSEGVECRIAFPQEVLVCETQVLYVLSVLVEPHRAWFGQVIVMCQQRLMVTPAHEMSADQVMSEMRHPPAFPQTLPVNL